MKKETDLKISDAQVAREINDLSIKSRVLKAIRDEEIYDKAALADHCGTSAGYINKLIYTHREIRQAFKDRGLLIVHEKTPEAVRKLIQLMDSEDEKLRRLACIDILKIVGLYTEGGQQQVLIPAGADFAGQSTKELFERAKRIARELNSTSDASRSSEISTASGSGTQETETDQPTGVLRTIPEATGIPQGQLPQQMDHIGEPLREDNSGSGGDGVVGAQQPPLPDA